MTTIKQMPLQNNHQPTNALLLEMYDDIDNMRPLYKHFHRSKIQEFRKNNGGRFDTIVNEIKKLQDEYFIVIEGQIQMETPLVDDKGAPINPNAPATPKLQENKTMENFQKEFQKLMSLPTTII